MTYYACLTTGCGTHGETSGTESGADAKHAKTGHATVTTTSAEWAARLAGAA